MIRAAPALAVWLAWTMVSSGVSSSALDERSQAETRFHVTARGAGLIEQGLGAAAPPDPQAAGFEAVPAPGVRLRADEARATSTPWIDSNGWRFQRGLRRAFYENLPAGAAPLAAAESFVFGATAILDPDPADIEELGRMLEFLNAQEQKALPLMANIGVVESDSPLLGEVLNLLTRRNLLYRVVAAPDPGLDVTVRLGSDEFPMEAAVDPSEFAARVRARLGDDNRLVRIYGTTTTIVRLTGDAKKARLYLLNYRQGRAGRGGGAVPTVRVRVRGRYQPGLAAFGAPSGATLTDVEHPDGATEFWVPDFRIIAIVDLDGLR